MNLHRLGAALLIGLATTVALAQPDRLQKYLDELQALRAEFTQSVYDEDGKIIQHASGVMLLRRPGKFRWNYVEPFEQIIVADGKKLWLYDKDLEQVTVRPIEAALSAGPLAILAGEQPLAEGFTITDQQVTDQLHWYALIPKATAPDATGEFSAIRLAFTVADGNLAELELIDAFERRTVMRLAQIERNPSLPDALFEFVPPEGVDVIGE